jgi:hypothetical protein
MMRNSQTVCLIDGGKRDRVSAVRHSAGWQRKMLECDLDQSGGGSGFLSFHPLH